MTPIIRSKQEIFNNNWIKNKSEISTIVRPPQWTEDRPMTIDDVLFWEEIYYRPGTVGIFVSWNPFAEFYLITYNLYSHLEQGIETFFGSDAYKQVMSRSAEFGIELKENKIVI